MQLEIKKLMNDLDSGLSLPASWYTDPRILKLEEELIFHRTWQYIGRTELLKDIGQYITGTAGTIPVVVIRNETGLEAFVNVCRHRRHPVAEGCGTAKLLQCPYHAWTYDLHGKLRVAPRCEQEETFQKENYPLLPVKAESWGPFVFVNHDLNAPSLSSLLGNLFQVISGSGLDLASLQFKQRVEWSSDSNWKVMIENYLECYHCPIRHPNFSRVINVSPNAYTMKADEYYFSQTAPVRKGGSLPSYHPIGEVTEAQYHFIWPNFTININPGHPNLSLDVWLPDGPEKTRGFSEYYFGKGVPEEIVQEIIAFNKQVGDEDDALTSSVQIGLRAGRPEQGRFLAQSEHLVIQFQRLLLSSLSTAR